MAAKSPRLLTISLPYQSLIGWSILEPEHRKRATFIWLNNNLPSFKIGSTGKVRVQTPSNTITRYLQLGLKTTVAGISNVDPFLPYFYRWWRHSLTRP